LSPELYLKRPALEGDRWRLDKILQRKAVCILTAFLLHDATQSVVMPQYVVAFDWYQNQ